jgi:hypothetical protein
LTLIIASFRTFFNLKHWFGNQKGPTQVVQLSRLLN